MSGKRLLTSLIQLIPLIVVITILFGAIGGYVNYFVLEPEYTATTTFYVMNTESDGNNTNYNLYTSSTLTYYELLAEDYSVLATSRGVEQSVCKNLGLSLEDGLSEYEISVSPVNETRVMALKVTGTDSAQAQKIANELVNVFTEKVKNTIGVENVNVVDYAYVEKTGPKAIRNTVFAAIAGAVLTVGIIVIKEFADTSFRTAEEVEDLLGLPVLAQVNRIKGPQSKDKKRK